MTTFLLVRHAAHVRGTDTIVGRTPGVPLSADGERSAAALANAFRGREVDAVYCSPVERAVQTARPIAERYGLDPVVNPAVTELDYGEWTATTLSELDADPRWNAWNARRSTARVPGGESMVEAQARAVGGLCALSRAHGPAATVVVVSHADIIKAVVLHCLQLSVDHVHRLSIDLASVTGIRLDETGGVVLSVNAMLV